MWFVVWLWFFVIIIPTLVLDFDFDSTSTWTRVWQIVHILIKCFSQMKKKVSHLGAILQFFGEIDFFIRKLLSSAFITKNPPL